MNDLFRNLSMADLFSDAPEGVAFLDREGRILKVNSAFCHMVQEKPQGAMNLSYFIAFQDKKAWDQQFRLFINSSKNHIVIISRFNSNRPESVRWWQLTIKKVRKDSFDGLVVLISDFTHIKELEARQRRAVEEAEAATRGKSEILANTSHEIRTPIHTIIGMTELMAETKLDEEQQEYSSQVQFAASVLLSLVNDILDISKIEAGKIQIEHTEFDLYKLMEALINLETLEVHKKGLELAYHIPPEIPQFVMGDPLRIRQIITNLISNARKFTSQGQIILNITHGGIKNGKTRLNFDVGDSGIGIPLDKQAKLFSAFQQADSSTTRKYGGTGLGLFISQNLVNQMGGTMGLTSEEGKGSHFSFTLDFEVVEKDNQPPKVSRDFYEGIRLLLVDDNDAIRNITKTYLEQWGCLVDEAANGEAALDLLKKGKGQETYALCIVDQAMRKMDGWQLASEVRADNSLKNLPLILTPLKGKGSDEAKMKLLGWFDDYLTKPISSRDLLEKVHHVLNLHQKGKSAPLELVRELSSPSEETSPYEQGRAAWGNRDILVVEDHLVNQQLFKTILVRLSCRVRCVENGLLALEAVKEQEPDLIFMDCQMPVMNGYESTREIRKTGSQVPIIAVTASAINNERIKCEEAGMNDLITKPFKKEDIMSVLYKYFSKEEQENSIPEELAPLEEEETVDISQALGVDEAAIFNFPAALETFLGDEATLVGLLAPYRKKVAAQLEELKKDTQGRDLDNIREVAHSIKGSSRNLDMKRLGNSAEKLENTARDGIKEPIPDLINELEEEFTLLCRVLDRY
jgi:two-component system sensor histidine kinase/response regulator